ncbi:MAG: NHL repeat-containing protein [Anaerolineae bacterium]|nr:NHL repeat-containing protein [Anaerolineae bacterium]
MTPVLHLGAKSPGRLLLSDAQSSPTAMNAPRGVYLDEYGLIVADTGNHRVLIWQGIPTKDGQPADLVLGQPDFITQGSAAGHTSPANGLHTPSSVLMADDRLYVADAWHHRVLVWNNRPTSTYQPPDYVLGQPDFQSVAVNRGGTASPTSLYWPYGMAFIAGWFFIADTGNRRVLAWNGHPSPDTPPDFIMGQSGDQDGYEWTVSAANFRWPYAIAGNADILYIADSGHHRVLGWSPFPCQSRPANIIFGQPEFSSSWEFPYGPQGPQRLRFPSALAIRDNLLAVADMSNNRVLFWNTLHQDGCFHAADAVIGQPDFSGNGENRWRSVEDDTLCWPYGLHFFRDWLVIADSGNNRVTLWRIEP